MGLLTQPDSTIFRTYFKEMVLLRGIPAIYQYPIDMDLSIHSEEQPKGFSEPIPTNVLFEQNPKITTLRKYGWVPEASEEVPYIISVEYDLKNLCKGCRFTISPIGTLNENSKCFVVSDITTNLEFPDSWVCKITPVFNGKTISRADYTNNANSFIKIKKDNYENLYK